MGTMSMTTILPSHSALVLFFVCGCMTSSETSLGYPELNFLSIHLSDNPSSGYTAVQSAINYTLTESSLLYPEAFANYSYYSERTYEAFDSCGVDALQKTSDNMLQLFQRKRIKRTGALTVIFAPLCIPAFTIVGDFARELDLLALTCTSSDGKVLGNKARFPSSISFSIADVNPYGEALLEVMRTYRWKTIAVVLDRQSGVGAAGRSTEACRAPIEQLRDHWAEFQVLVVETDSTVENFTRALVAARRFSQIMLICTLATPLRRMLIDASGLNMTQGEYIFFALYEIEIPGEPWPPVKWQRNDTWDQAARQALKSLLIVGSPTINWTALRGVTSGIAQRRTAIFGASGPKFEHNEFEVTCHEAVAATAKLLNEICRDSIEKCLSGKFVAGQMSNRSYDFDSDQYETIAHYDSSRKILRKSPVNEARWILGAPPPDRPVVRSAQRALPSDDGGACHRRYTVLNPSAVCFVTSYQKRVRMVEGMKVLTGDRVADGGRWTDRSDGGPSTEGKFHRLADGSYDRPKQRTVRRTDGEFRRVANGGR
ncbi:hypothetical protein BV898_18117 [Hypsibius exemplaris]|uniref:Receptor ligand binding region domain-containing protein n=1 Tax=Hypsibius exemplaris TaxID=2072580 RepID=A0A9X6NGZ3_HYPEX|nr:hypothetical protein BV898_18117 [Hypsibius exemplaris]